MAYQAPARGYRQLRKGRFSQTGGIYLVTTTTLRRKPLFTTPALANTAARAFTAPVLLKNNRLLCWVLMPDHVHWLVQLGEGQPLSPLVGAMKSATARQLRLTGYTGNVWAKGFHDRALRREVDCKPAARYIIANPVRAGLVEHVGDYPYWDAVWL